MSRKKYVKDLKFFDIVPKMMEMAGLHHYTDLAKLLDIKPQTINQSRVRNQFPPGQVINFAIKTNTSLDELFDLKKNVKSPQPGVDKQAIANLKIGTDEDEFIFVPHWRGIEEKSIFGRVLMEIKKIWLEEFFTDNKNGLMAWTMNSDEMKGPYDDSIQKNSVILIDKKKTTIDSSGVYAFTVNDEVIVRRVLKNLDGSVDLVSDNPAYQSRDPLQGQRLTHGELKILGRVAFIGHAI